MPFSLPQPPRSGPLERLVSRHVKYEEIVWAGDGYEELVSDGGKPVALIERARGNPTVAPQEVDASVTQATDAMCEQVAADSVTANSLHDSHSSKAPSVDPVMVRALFRQEGRNPNEVGSIKGT